MEYNPLVRSAPTPQSTRYVRFKGIDLSADPALIDPGRSPDAPNLISDSGGYPEKRLGWRSLCRFEKRINGIHRGVLTSGEYILVHSGDGLYSYCEGNAVLLCDGLNDDRSFSFVARGRMWILTGREYLVFDGERVTPVADIAYAPTTVLSSPPEGGGYPFEAVNLLTPRRKNSFLSDGTATKYVLDCDGIDLVESVKVNGEEVEGYTVDLEEGSITFADPPEAPEVTGQDNLTVTFSKTVEGYSEVISRCRFAAAYGFDSTEGERVFFSGNPDKPNVDWHCEAHDPDYLSDPAYVPDTSFAYIGADSNPIMGYRRLEGYMAIIKGQNDQDATVFLRSSTVDEDGEAVFPVMQGAAGYGAVSPYSIASLGGEPLFLSPRGIIGIASEDITDSCTMQNRSYFADAGLCAERDLSQAVAAEWDGRYILAVNGGAYLLDGRQQKTYLARSGGDYVYECFRFENIPARVLCEADGTLYFGTEDGRFCRFNNDIVGMERFSDDGEPIVARWSTKADDDGDFGRYKQLLRRGCAVMLKPYTRSSVKIYLRTESDFGELVRSEMMDIFDFNEFDFSRISFNTSDMPQVCPVNRKVRHYITLQITVENDSVNEGFGVYGIVKRYTKGRYVK